MEDIMKTIFSTLKTCLETEDAVLVTVVAGSGSTPRGAGATMVINASGRLAGTIGGGMVEYKSQLLALDLLKTKENHLKEFRLTPNQVEDLGMICGGDVNVYFRVFKAQDGTPWHPPAGLAGCSEQGRGGTPPNQSRLGAS